LRKQKITTTEQDFRLFLECLIEAGSRMYDPHNFQLPEAGREKPKFRERVYCYELYHQLRNALESKLADFAYKLDGEVDKAGHRIIRGEMKPDFIVHLRGEMNRNLVVIEVKPLDVEPRELRKDIGKLKRLVEEAGYQQAIMLIYGGGKQDDLPPQILAEARRLLGDDKKTLLLWHSGPGKEPIVVE